MHPPADRYLLANNKTFSYPSFVSIFSYGMLKMRKNDKILELLGIENANTNQIVIKKYFGCDEKMFSYSIKTYNLELIPNWHMANYLRTRIEKIGISQKCFIFVIGYVDKRFDL